MNYGATLKLCLLATPVASNGPLGLPPQSIDSLHWRKMFSKLVGDQYGKIICLGGDMITGRGYDSTGSHSSDQGEGRTWIVSSWKFFTSSQWL